MGFMDIGRNSRRKAKKSKKQNGSRQLAMTKQRAANNETRIYLYPIAAYPTQ